MCLHKYPQYQENLRCWSEGEHAVAMQQEMLVMKAWSAQIHWTPRLHWAGRVLAHGFYSICQQRRCINGYRGTYSASWQVVQSRKRLSSAAGSKGHDSGQNDVPHSCSGARRRQLDLSIGYRKVLGCREKDENLSVPERSYLHHTLKLSCISIGTFSNVMINQSLRRRVLANE